MKQDIVKNVYEDSDGHVKMQVTKMLSDGACAYLDICYQALDDKGKRWLSDKKMGINAIKFLYKGDIVGKTVGYASFLEEYKDMATEQERYFTFHYRDYSGNFNLNKIERILSYPMCEKKGEGKIKVSSNMDTFAYRLKGTGSPSKFYEPGYMLVSKLSYGIFGKDLGVSTRIYNANGEETGEYMNEDFLASPDYSDGVTVFFIKKDGSKMKYDNMAQFTTALGIPGYDLAIAAGYFDGKKNHIWRSHETINPEELAGVTINGVYYDLVQ